MVDERQGAIPLLFTVDNNYLRHLAVVVRSLQINDPGYRYALHIICNDPSDAMRAEIESLCLATDYTCTFYRAAESLFDRAPVSRRYPREMYFRLLAGNILPASLKRIIYLDPDILLINPLRPLWALPMEDHLFLGATHLEYREGLQRFDQLRLGTDATFFNTGVLVMDLEKARLEIRAEDIRACIDRKSPMLLLPDQDVFNMLYGARTKQIPDEIWNYDARKYNYYLSHSGGLHNERWVMDNTAVLHFCGRVKPWNDGYPYRFGHLYLHYAHLADRLTESFQPTPSGRR